MADNKITYQEYWKEVRDIAKNIVDEVKEEAGGGSTRRVREAAHDRLHEAVDGHQWIIYTWAYPWVLMHAQNEDAVFDDQGEQQAQNYAQIMQLMAFYAFKDDIAAEMEGVLDKHDEDDDE